MDRTIDSLRTRDDYISVLTKVDGAKRVQRGRHMGVLYMGHFIAIPRGRGTSNREIPRGTRGSINRSCDRLGMWKFLIEMGIIDE